MRAAWDAFNWSIPILLTIFTFALGYIVGWTVRGGEG